MELTEEEGTRQLGALYRRIKRETIQEITRRVYLGWAVYLLVWSSWLLLRHPDDLKTYRRLIDTGMLGGLGLLVLIVGVCGFIAAFYASTLTRLSRVALLHGVVLSGITGALSSAGTWSTATPNYAMLAMGHFIWGWALHYWSTILRERGA